MPASSQPFPHVRGVSLSRAASGHVVGTPSAFGAIRARKPSPLSQSMTLAPTRGSPLATNDFVVPEPAYDHDEWGASDAQAEELAFENEEAQLLLEVARARRTICRLERELAEAKSEENICLGRLYRHRAEEAERRLASAEYEVGYVRNRMRDTEVAVPVSEAPRKRKRHRTSRSAGSVDNSNSR